MQKIRILLQSVLKLFSLTGVCAVLLACGGGQTSEQPPAQSPQPGMHVYKDPLSGKFVAQPPVSDRVNPPVLPQALQQIKRTDTKPAPRPAQEYTSPAEGGGILLDLPAPYSAAQE